MADDATVISVSATAGTSAGLDQLFAIDGVSVPGDGAVVEVDNRLAHRTPALTPPGGVAEFESGEHTYLGNEATLYFDDGVTVQAGASPLVLGAPYTNSVPLTYGNIVALAGDYYGASNGVPISDWADLQAGFADAFGTLANADPGEVNKLLALIQVEIDAVNQAIGQHKQPSTAYASLGHELFDQANAVTNGRCQALALVNWDHFGADALNVYSAGHAVAMAQAVKAKGISDPAQRKAALWVAYAMNAFADHFLTDIFSAGHMRTPRRALYGPDLWAIVLSLCSWFMHDEDCCWGLNVTNQHGDSWTAYGDKKLLDGVDAANLAIVQAAVQASIDDVWAAYSGTAAPQPGPLQLTPNLAPFTNPGDPTNPSPMFIAQDGKVLRREDLGNRNDYHWGWWFVDVTLYRLWRHNYGPCANTDVPVEFTSRIVQLWSDGGTLAMSVFEPDDTGSAGFTRVWKSDLAGNGPNAVAWLAAQTTAAPTNDIVQVWANGSDVGLTTYRAQPDGSYQQLAPSFPAGNGPAGAWLTGNVLSTELTDIIQAWSDGGTTAFTVYTADAQGSGAFAQAAKRDVANASYHDGDVWLAGNVLSSDATDVIQVSGGGNVTLTVYTPDSSGNFSQAAQTSPAGNGPAALAWLTGSVARPDATDLIQVWSDSGTAAFTVYTADGSGNYSQYSKGPAPGNGTGALGWFTGAVIADAPPAVIQVWTQGALGVGSVGITVYAPDSQGAYQQAWKSTFASVPVVLAATAVLVGDNEAGLTEIIVISPGPGGGLKFNTFAPVGDGSYRTAGQASFFDDGARAVAWMTASTFEL